MNARPGIASRLYRWLLLAYPRDFRRDCAREMLETLQSRLAAQRREAPRKGTVRGRAGLLRILRFWCLEYRAVLRGGLSLRLESRRARRAGIVKSGAGHRIAASLDSILQDLRFGLRTLRRRPLFTTISVGTLGLGIGATTAMFSVVEGVLLRDAPYERPHELVSVWGTYPRPAGRGGSAGEWGRGYLSWPEYDRWRGNQTLFQDVAIFGTAGATLTGSGTPERIRIGVASSSLFPVLGVRPALGRSFLPGEDGPGAEPVAVISSALWQERFGSDPDVLGSTVALNDRPFTIVGVLPPDFRLRGLGGFARQGDSGDRPLWIPVGAERDELLDPNRSYEGVARLAPGTTMEQARAETDVLIRGDKAPSERGAGMMRRQADELRGISSPLLLLLGSSLVLLLVGCGNVATLVMGEVTGRRHEMATRVALGAKGARLGRQLLTESVILGVAGSGLGILLALVGTDVLVAMAPPVPHLDRVGMNGSVLLCGVFTGVMTGLLFGMAPLAELTVGRLHDTLRGGGRIGGQRDSRFLRAIVSVELGLTVVLLVSGGLLTRSLVGLLTTDPGISVDRLVTVRPLLGSDRYPTPTERAATIQRIRQAMEGVPGVERATGVSSLPFSGYGEDGFFEIEGRERRLDERSPSADRRQVLPGYHETMGIPILAGRTVTESDGADQPLVTVISESMARRFWPDESPLGARIRFRERTYTVVGIVGDLHHESLAAEVRPTFYLPLVQAPEASMSLVVRTAGDPTALIPALRRAVWSVDPNAPVTQAATVSSLLAATSGNERFRTVLMMVFGVCAALLAGAGVFGVAARSVARRSREMGIRMALGARQEGLVRGVVTSSLPASLMGLGLGLVVAFWVSRLLAQFLFGVASWDPLTYGAVAASLAALTVAASWIPARRITRIAPMEVLREE